MDELKLLQERYLELINQVLPRLAKERQFPVRYNHCFGRIVLDNLFGCCWYEVLSRRNGSAYKQLNHEQLKRAIEIAETIIVEPEEYIAQLNQNSLRWPGKLRETGDCSDATRDERI